MNQRWKTYSDRIPYWLKVTVIASVTYDIANGIWLAYCRPGASNARLSDFRDPLVVQSWSAHSILMYGIAAIILYLLMNRNNPASGLHLRQQSIRPK